MILTEKQANRPILNMILDQRIENALKYSGQIFFIILVLKWA